MASKPEITCEDSRCTGCRLCMLACSWVNSKTHQPTQAFVHVDVDEKNFTRRITLDRERCTGCLACVSFCPSGALQSEKNEGKPLEGGI